MGSAKMKRVRPFFDTTEYTKVAALSLNHRNPPPPPAQIHTFILRHLSRGSLKIRRNILYSQLQSTLQRDGLRCGITVVSLFHFFFLSSSFFFFGCAGCLPFDHGNFTGKFSKNPKNAKFTKCEPFD